MEVLRFPVRTPSKTFTIRIDLETVDGLNIVAVDRPNLKRKEENTKSMTSSLARRLPIRPPIGIE